MNLAFNELSVLPLVENEFSLKNRFLDIAETFKDANAQFGFSHIIFPSDIGKLQVTVDKTFYQWAFAIPHQGEKNKILSLIKKPFTDDALAEQKEELNAYYFEHQDLAIALTYCIGLATAHLTEVPALSLCTHDFWKQEQINFVKDDIVENTLIPVHAFNLSDVQSVNNPNFVIFADSIAHVELMESSIDPTLKPIHFRDDHGTDVLMAFAKKLRNSKYVTSVINSLPFNSNTVRFIKKIFPDGKIEIVLHWEDKGYGMIIQTTGRNFRETKAIAAILQNDYDH